MHFAYRNHELHNVCEISKYQILIQGNGAVYINVKSMSKIHRFLKYFVIIFFAPMRPICVCALRRFFVPVCAYMNPDNTLGRFFFFRSPKRKNAEKKWSVGSARLFLFFLARRECRNAQSFSSDKNTLRTQCIECHNPAKAEMMCACDAYVYAFFSPVAHKLQNLFTRRAISNDCPIFLTTYVIKINRTRVCVYIIIFFNL